MPEISKSLILHALTSSVRIISGSQAARLLGRSNMKSVGRTIDRLTTSGLVERVGSVMALSAGVASPLFRWQANQVGEEPNFESLASTLKNRRKGQRIQTDFWRATSKGLRTTGKQTCKRSARRGDWEHDLGVTETWLCLLGKIAASDSKWVLEDDFEETELMELHCKPDAIIWWPSGRRELIEYGGCYSADTLRLKFESWRNEDWQLF